MAWINAATTGERFDMRKAKEAIAQHYHAILTDAFEQRIKQVGGAAVMLDALLEIAQVHGFPGSRVQAERILQAGGVFAVGRSPGDRLAVWRKSAGAL